MSRENRSTKMFLARYDIFNTKYKYNKQTVPWLDVDASLLEVVESVEDGRHAPGLYWVGVPAD